MLTGLITVQNERNEVKRLRAQLDSLATVSRLAQADTGVSEVETATPEPKSPPVGVAALESVSGVGKETQGEAQRGSERKGDAERDDGPASRAKTRVKFQSPRAD